MNGNAKVEEATEKQKFEIAAALVKTIPAICEGMNKKIAQMYVEDQKFLAELFVEAGRKALMPLQASHVFSIWKTIKLGTGFKTVDDFRKALKANGHRIGDWGNDILGKPAFTMADKETEIDLVVVSNADLGFKEGAYLKDTYKRALELGLVLCPNEVGPQLRLQYTDQPMNEWLLVAMEPIKVSDGALLVFYVVRNDGGSWLHGHNGHPGNRRYAGNRFVFALPRK